MPDADARLGWGRAMTDQGSAFDDDLLPIPWEQLKGAFEIDGSWRDIYALETDLATWERVLAWIRGLEAAGVARLVTEPDPLPATVARIMESRATTGEGMAFIHIGDLQINCHFFGEEEVEFDIDPREVRRPKDARTVLDFMSGLAAVAERTVHLTEENASDQRWVTYDPRSNQWQFLPRGPA